MYKSKMPKPIPKKKVSILLMKYTVLATEVYIYTNFSDKYFHYTLHEKGDLL
jgi:hypothetical protein